MNIELKKKKEQANGIIRQGLYILLMIIGYVLISTVNTGAPLPLLPVCCGVCYAVREEPFNSAVYGCVCGLLLDSAQDTLVGFNAILLMWSCLFISLLFHCFLRRHIVNFLLLDLGVIMLRGLLHYLFFYEIWDYDLSGQIFGKIFIPEMLYTCVAGAVVFWLTGVIAGKFGTVTEHYIEEKSEDIVRE
ncbi:MAG: hypothetical protein K2K57_01675 [Oscillospiraceae bacterium]|nr:hypothetical protein [Oscillospiraceae bacterium]